MMARYKHAFRVSSWEVKLFSTSLDVVQKHKLSAIRHANKSELWNPWGWITDYIKQPEQTSNKAMHGDKPFVALLRTYFS